MQRALLISVLFYLCAISISGCASENTNIRNESYVLHGDLVTSGYTISDRLLAELKVKIEKSSRIIVTSFVNIDNLTESSTLGRMLSEHVASRLSQQNHNVVEMRLRTSSVFMEERKGEFLLSRDLKDVSKNQNATAVLVGTYGLSPKGNIVYISARIVNPSDGSILSSCDYGLELQYDKRAPTSGSSHYVWY